MADLNLTTFDNAVCLYCYYNHPQSLNGIENLDLPEKLQCQHNEITEIPELRSFVIQKADLRQNKISKMSGFSQQPDLRKLYLSYQDVTRVELSEGCFASQSLSLEVLELAHCRIDDLREIRCLENLQVLNLTENQINSFDELKTLFASCTRIDSIDLRGNPICEQVKYREKVIIMGYFHELDAKEMLDTQRETLIRMQIRKNKSVKKAEAPKIKNPLMVKHLEWFLEYLFYL